MGLNVGSLLATLDLDRKPFQRGFAAWRTEARAGARAATRDLDAETSKQTDLLGKAGEKGGREFGEGFRRDSAGRLRDAFGRFAKQSDDEGERSGRRWGLGFLRGVKLRFDGDKAKDLAEGLGKALRTGLTFTAKAAAASYAAQLVPPLVAALASGIAKAAHGAGSIAALLPAAALTGVTAMAALKLAVVGVGDALSAAATGDAEEFHEAVQGLSPAARRFALEVRHLRGDLSGLKDTVQERFFSAFEGQTSRLGKTWLPILRRELGGVSGLFGDAVDRFAGWARQPAVVLTLSAALGNARRTLGNLLDGATNLPQVFLPLATVGSTFLPRLSRGLDDVTARWALWMQHAADTGQLADFIQGGIDKLKQLWETTKQVVRIGGNVIDIFRLIADMSVFDGLNTQGGGLLDTIERLTERAKAFFGSSESGQVLAEVMSAVHTVMAGTLGVVVRLARLAGQIFAPLLPDIAKANEAVLGFEQSLVDALEPTLRGIAKVLGVILPPLTGLLELMSDNKVIMGAVAGVVVALFAAWAAGAIKAKLATASANKALGGIAAGLGAMIALAGQLEAQNQAKAMEEMAEGLAAIDYAATEASKAAIRNAESMGLLDEQFAAAEQSGGDAARKLVELMEAAGVSEETVAHYRREIQQAADAQANQATEAERAEQALRDYRDEIDNVIGRAQSVPEAVDRLTLSLQDAADHFTRQKEEAGAAGLALDGNSAAAAANREVMRGLVEDGAQVIETMAEQGATSGELRSEINRQKLMLIALAERYGLNDAVVEGYIETLSSIPTRRNTHIGVTGVGAVLDNLEAIRRSLNSIDDTSFHVSSPAHGGGGKTMHDGGVVPGPRGSEVAAVLQAGERVLAIDDPLNRMLTAGAAQLAHTSTATPARTQAPAPAGGGLMRTVRLLLEGTGILEGLRREVWITGGGDVQVALGTR